MINKTLHLDPTQIDSLSMEPASPGNWRRTDMSRLRTLDIRGDTVFVHKKLVRMLQQRRAENLDMSDDVPAPVSELVEQCWVPIDEAVSVWGVMPDGVQIRQDQAGQYYLLQTDLNCMFPGMYDSKEDAYRAAAQVMRGCIIMGKGITQYRGQPLTPINEFKPFAGAPMPSIFDQAPVGQASNALLRHIPFREGFDLVDRPVYDWVKTQEAQTYAALDGMARFLKGVLRLDSLLAHLPYERLQTDGSTLVPQEEGIRMATVYPELAKTLPEATMQWSELYVAHFGGSDLCLRRKDAFLLVFLAGVLVASDAPNVQDIMLVGQAISFAMTLGMPPDHALECGRQVYAFLQSVRAKSTYVARVMDRLERDEAIDNQLIDKIALHTSLRQAFNTSGNLTH